MHFPEYQLHSPRGANYCVFHTSLVKVFALDLNIFFAFFLFHYNIYLDLQPLNILLKNTDI